MKPIASILVILLALSTVKDGIVKFAVERGTKAATGLNLTLGKLQIGLIKTLVNIQDLRIYNPRGFGEKIMLNMPEIYVNYDLPAVFKGKIHLNEVRINLSEFNVIKNAKGEVNLDSLKVVKDSKEKAPALKHALCLLLHFSQAFLVPVLAHPLFFRSNRAA